MKKIFFLGLLCAVLFIGTPRLMAVDSEPAGKNLLNPARFEISMFDVETVLPISVLPNTTYTLTVPNEDSIYESLIHVFTSEHDYIHELNTEQQTCTNSGSLTHCTFTTGTSTTELHIAVRSTESNLYQYTSTFGLKNFQLELGNTPTSYEPYIGYIHDETPPEFQGEGTLITSYTSYLPLEYIIGEYITAYDEIDGDLTDQIVIESDNYTGYEQTVGQYLVSLSVTDSSMNKALFDLHILVKDEVDPIITGPTRIDVDVDEQLSLATIIERHFEFYDEYDGVIEDYTVITDDYSDAKNQLGETEIKLAIEDSSGNQTSKTVIINVKDYVAPVIDGPETIHWYHSDDYHIDNIFDDFNVTDNHTKAEDVNFFIHDHNLPENMKDPGLYTVELIAEDESGNISTHELTVHIHDDIAPVIDGPDHLTVSYTEMIELTELIEMLEVTDNYASLSQDDLLIIENTYSEHASIPGLYRVIFSVDDGYNLTTHTTYIRVIDDVPPVFSFDSRIVIEQGSTLSNDELLNLLRHYDLIAEFNPTDVEINRVDNDEHSASYTMYLTLRNDQDETIDHAVYVDVVAFSEANQNEIDYLPYVVLTFVSISSLIYLIKRKR